MRKTQGYTNYARMLAFSGVIFAMTCMVDLCRANSNLNSEFHFSSGSGSAVQLDFPETADELMHRYRQRLQTVSREKYMAFRRPYPGYSEIEAEKGWRRLRSTTPVDDVLRWDGMIRMEHRDTLHAVYGMYGDDSCRTWETLARVSALMRGGRNTSVFLEAQGRLRTSGADELDQLNSGDLIFREAYLDLFYDHFRGRLGWQILAWGQADGLNPTDNINPHDFRQFITVPAEERKRSVPGLRLDFQWQETNLDIFYTPVFTPHRLPEEGSIWESHFQKRLREAQKNPLVNVESHEPERLYARNGTFGTRVSGTLGNTDWSVSAVKGPDPMPAITSWGYVPVESDLIPTNLRTFHPDRTIIGGDAATVFGSHVFRLEGALISGLPYPKEITSIFQAMSPQDGVEKARTSSIIFGFDRPVSPLLYYNLQYYHREIYTDVPLAVPKIDNGIMLNVSGGAFEDYLEWEYSGIKHTMQNGFYSNIELRVNPFPSVQAGLGWHIFGGRDDDSDFGQYRDNDEIYAFAEWRF